jgi:hypothetical protein
MVETVGIHQVMWFVMLESAKDQVIGVDTPGKQVLPCIFYLFKIAYFRSLSLGANDFGNL